MQVQLLIQLTGDWFGNNDQHDGQSMTPRHCDYYGPKCN